MSEVKKTTSVSMTDELKERVKDLAKKEGRTFSNMVVHLIEKSLPKK